MCVVLEGRGGLPGAEVTGDCELTIWVLGTELRTSGRAASALNYCATSPAPEEVSLKVSPRLSEGSLWLRKHIGIWFVVSLGPTPKDLTKSDATEPHTWVIPLFKGEGRT